jgi:DNA invertase Pin-like site-specific DNA recombinase
VIPCFGYLRVSGLTQATETAGGLPRQESAIRSWAALNGYEIVKLFTDGGVSGKTDLENRPALQELLSELGQVTVVIIEKVDRLARFLMIQESIIADFQRRGVTVISTCEPDLCSDDPTRVLMRQVLGAFAQYERSLIVNRLKAGADRKRAQGHKWGGRKRYGKNPEEISIVQKIHDLSIEGLTLTAIATNLNDSGIKPRSGKQFYPMQIARILTQEKDNATH